MKLSSYITALQAILERDGDLDVVQQNRYGDIMAGGCSFSSVSTPVATGKFRYHGREFAISNYDSLPNGSELIGKVVKVD